MKSISIKILQGSLLMLTVICMNCTFIHANVVLPAVFTDNMVLQQKTKAAIWGKADPGTVVQVSTTWGKMVYASTADRNGKWKVMIATPAYGGPYMINISGGNSIVLRNVLIGEVWLCSGQSNMEMPLAGWGNIKNYKQEIAAAKYPKIRLLQVERTVSNSALEDAKIVRGGWNVCSPETIGDFSSVAYFYARELYKKTGIPIGLIHTSWGGTIAEAWTSGATLKNMPDFAAAAGKIEKSTIQKDQAEFSQKLNRWQKQLLEKDSGYYQGKPLWAQTSFNASSWNKMAVPGYWEKSGLPDFDGIVWFRKKVTIPESWAGKDLKFSLGPIDDNDVTFFNGVKIGENNVFTEPRNYIIPGSKVKAGTFVLAVRVFDTGGGGGFSGDKKIFSVSSAGEKSIRLDGEWQYKASSKLKDIDPMPVLNDGPNRPTVLYNGMINPFIQFSIRGVIWYQGESNADRASQYNELFPALIKDWRRKWNIGDFPFYYVQLASFMKRYYDPVPSTWAELRDAQSKTLSLPNTGMAVTIDIGEEQDIHPKNKQDVGKRLALIALAKTYGYKTPYSGPALSSFKVVGDKIIADFKFVDGGLKTKDGGPVNGFTIAGANNRYYWATATIQGNQIVLSAPEVTNPVAIRYAWADNPDCNLFNGAGLPASPFRTDDWEVSTFGKK